MLQLAELDSDSPPEDRARANISWDAADSLIEFYADNPPPWHWSELAWTLRRHFPDDGLDLFERAALYWDPPKNRKRVWRAWAQATHAAPTQFDTILLDAMNDARWRGWTPPAEIGATFQRLAGDEHEGQKADRKVDRFRAMFLPDTDVDDEFDSFKHNYLSTLTPERRRSIECLPICQKMKEATTMTATIHSLGSTPNSAAPAARIRPRRIDAASLEGKAAPDREWLVPGLIPAKNVTLLYGDGGTGKSLLALQLALAVVAGSHFFGRPVAQGRTEFVTAEDSMDEMHRRLADVARLAGTPIGKLTGLHLTSLADEDAILAAPEDGRGGTLNATTLYSELEGVLAESRPALLVLDTLADIYGGNEIIRAQARQFISMLRRLCLLYNCTVVVLAHPSLAGMEKGTSGSTGWNNSVRSRLYFQRVHDSDGTEDDEDARVLRVGKSNYGRVGAEIAMRWQAGAFVPVAVTAGGDSLVRQAKADRVFLELMAKYTAQDRPVSVATGANFAPKLFQTEARGAGISKRDLANAMSRLLDNGRIKNVPYGPPSRGTKRLEVSTDKLTPPPG